MSNDPFMKYVERREEQIRTSSRSSSWLWILLALACAAVVLFLVLRGNPATGPVNPNKASAELLSTLDGVGPEIASKIIAGRPYYSIEDLKKVPGIGDKTFEKMKPRLTLD
jgi:competence protein ComEA